MLDLSFIVADVASLSLSLIYCFPAKHDFSLVVSRIRVSFLEVHVNCHVKFFAVCMCSVQNYSVLGSCHPRATDIWYHKI
jgi:hypothetical protein